MIKYKGRTSDLLADLSLEFGTSINLKQSEVILIHFFQWLTQNLSSEEKAQLICSLPTFIKPFCSSTAPQSESVLHLYKAPVLKKTVVAVLITLQRYITAPIFFQLCNCFPDPQLFQTAPTTKKIFLVA